MNLKLTNLLFSLGAHLGEQKSKVYPMNSYFILGVRNNLHIIDLQFTIYSLKKACKLMVELGKNNNYLFFYYTNISNLDSRIISFLIYHLYKNNHCFVFNSWKHGLLSNFNMQASDILIDSFPENKGMNYNFTFTSLLFKIISYSFYTREVGVRWSKHFKSINKYWRFFTYYKFFKNLNIVPDAAIIVNANKMITPVKECNSLKIPVIGPVDTETDSKYYTYPIPSNDNSFILAAFFLMSFITCYKKGQVESYSEFVK